MQRRGNLKNPTPVRRLLRSARNDKSAVFRLFKRPSYKELKKRGGVWTDIFSNWASLGDWANGENRILVLSETGKLMHSVTINSQFGFQSLGGLDQLKQTEISGLTPVPEPATMLLLGTGLLGLAGFGRKKLFKK